MQRLSEREQQVVEVIRGGKVRCKDIATALGISTRTVHAHLTNIYVKIDVHSVAALAQWAERRGVTQ